MIEKVANNLVEQMAGQNIIDKEMEEYYIYAFISIAEKIITVGSILIISLFSNTFISTLLFLVFFLSLRKRTGGFHLNSFGQCYLGTIAIYIAVLFINSSVTSYPYVLFGLLLLSICVIWIIGTVNHPNMHMDAMELSESKKAARIMVLLEGSVIFFFAFIGVDMHYIGYMSIGIIICATLMCVAKIIKQEVK